MPACVIDNRLVTVNRLRKELQKKFYNDRIRNLKSSNNSKWWKQIKSMSGLKLGNDDIAAFENIVYRDAEVQISDLPDVINSFLVSVTDGVPALCLDSLLNLRNELTACPNEFVVYQFEVYSVLMKLNVR